MGFVSQGYIRPDTEGLRWMVFVDGENLVARAQASIADAGLRLREGERYQKDAFVWFEAMHARARSFAGQFLQPQALAKRAYYYTSVQGDEPKRLEVHRLLWNLGFSPNVFRRDKKERSKGVDIALTKDMLSHAYQSHYDIAALVSGDGDYLPLVEEVKRVGCTVVDGTQDPTRFDADVEWPEVGVIAGTLNGRAVVRVPELDRGSTPV